MARSLRPPWQTPLVAAALLTTVLHAPAAAPAEHPHLGGMEDTPCSACHEVTDGPVVHGPAAGDCALCHRMEIGAEETAVELVAPQPRLCLRCHGTLAALAAGEAAVPHPALDMLACTDCHHPHAAQRPGLLRGEPGEECRACHDDRYPGDGEAGHGIVALAGCHACHAPHGGGGETLLRADGPRLCLACHAAAVAALPAAGDGLLTLLGVPVPAARAREAALAGLAGDHGHPVAGHRTLGTPTERELRRTDTPFRGELTCLTCHDPHKGRSPALLAHGAVNATELCGRCHPDV